MLEYTQFQHSGEFKTLLDGFLVTIAKSAGASAAAVRVLSPNGLQMVGSVGLPTDLCEGESIVDFDCGICGKAVLNNDIRMSNATACARHSGNNFFGRDCKSVIAIALEYQGSKIGVLNLFFSSAKETPDETSQIFRSFAELLGIALENARLDRENRRMSLMTERQSMANEIHDSLAQTMVFARMRMSLLVDAVQKHDQTLALKFANDVNDALGEGQKAVRELITHFRVPMDPQGLPHALSTLADEYRDRTNISLEYVNKAANIDLPLEHELQVFNIVREVLANVAIHSCATRARMSIEQNGSSYIFTITDNGIGCVTPKEGHYGLAIMRERAQRLGGEIQMESSKGMGTTVLLTFPVPKEKS